MCIIVAKPPKVAISEDIINNCYENNSHGAGFAWLKGRQVFISNGYMDLDEFKKAFYTQVPNKCSALLHFRIASKGKICVENTQPIRVSPSVAVAHNGTFNQYGDDEQSDSYDINNKIFTPYISRLGFKTAMSYPFKELLNDKIGGNRIAFLGAGAENHIYLLGGEWHKDHGLVFSNKSYEPRRSVQPVSNTLVKKANRPKTYRITDNHKVHIPDFARDHLTVMSAYSITQGLSEYMNSTPLHHFDFGLEGAEFCQTDICTICDTVETHTNYLDTVPIWSKGLVRDYADRRKTWDTVKADLKDCDTYIAHKLLPNKRLEWLVLCMVWRRWANIGVSAMLCEKGLEGADELAACELLIPKALKAMRRRDPMAPEPESLQNAMAYAVSCVSRLDFDKHKGDFITIEL